MTLGLPLLERDGLGDRLKSVAQRREELRATPSRRAERQARRAARRAHQSYMKSDAGPLQAGQYAGIARTRKDKLAQAGYRGQAPLIAFMFFRFVMPFIVFVVALFYLFVVTASALVAA